MILTLVKCRDKKPQLKFEILDLIGHIVCKEITGMGALCHGGTVCSVVKCAGDDVPDVIV